MERDFVLKACGHARITDEQGTELPGAYHVVWHRHVNGNILIKENDLRGLACEEFRNGLRLRKGTRCFSRLLIFTWPVNQCIPDWEALRFRYY